MFIDFENSLRFENLFKTKARFFVLFGAVSTQVAFRVLPKRTQVEAQYWGNPKLAWLEGTPARSI